MKFIKEFPEKIQENLNSRQSPLLSIENFLKEDTACKELRYKIERSQKGSVEQRHFKVLLKPIEEAFLQTKLKIPNILHDSVPQKNRVERTWGNIPEFNFPPKDHTQLGDFNFPAASKLSGSRFSVSQGTTAQLERALINFMLDIHTSEHGYIEMLLPQMVNSKTMRGTGQLPKFNEDLFKIEDSDLWLIPTAEVPLVNIHADEIIKLPIRYVAHTSCFRKEAGSYGKDTKGILRQHQFNKVELVQFTKPEDSYSALENIVSHAETVLKYLKIPYRVITLCAEETGFAAAKTYDIEVWIPSQNTYREISSCSNCTDFQARRANIRFRGQTKLEFVHTLNGSGLAVGRTVVAILENFQNKDGSITIPKILKL